MSSWYNFVTVDVFTTSPYEGNPLAIVQLPKGASITEDQKLKVTKEFNLSETVFLHEDSEAGNGRRFDIFTVVGEIPWAGHPTIGTICYIGGMESEHAKPEHFLLKSKAGLLNARYDRGSLRAEAEIPVNFHLHSRDIPAAEALRGQTALLRYLKEIPTSYPIASIVNGMNFVLVELATLEELSHVGKGDANFSSALDYLDKDWNLGLFDLYFFTFLLNQDGTTKVRTRMIDPIIGEDPATGSAASALACYLTSKVAGEKLIHTCEIEQGVEMGRRSLINVRVELDETLNVKRVFLSGQAVKIQEGKILV